MTSPPPAQCTDDGTGRSQHSLIQQDFRRLGPERGDGIPDLPAKFRWMEVSVFPPPLACLCML